MVSISVVMPTYNTEVPILREAVESILSQTFRDFEFIIIDDGSDNDSTEYLESLEDQRVRLIRNPQNLGITKSLNIGFKEAKGKYIARMDSDDIAVPVRLEKQFAFMERHSSVIACGSNIEFFGAYSAVSHNRIKDMETYRITALFVNPGPIHPTAFFNRELLLRYRISYDEKLTYSQDYGLWVEISKYGKVCLLKDVLLRYRVHENQITYHQRNKQVQCAYMVLRKQLQGFLGDVSDEKLELHCRYSTGYYRDAVINDEMLNWFHRLITANNRLGLYDKRKFRFYVNDTVIKRTIYQSFGNNMNYLYRISMFFRYLPFPYALKAAAGMISRNSIRSITMRQD